LFKHKPLFFAIEPSAKNAQQSVQRIFGSLRGLQAFFWLQVFSAPKQFLSPPKIR